MDASKKLTRKLYSIVSDSLSELSTIMSRNDEFQSSLDNNAFDQTFDQSMELRENDTVVMSRVEYNKLQSELNILEESLHSSSKQKDEYKKLLLDYDTTMSFILEKEESTNINALLGKLEKRDKLIKDMQQEIEEHRHLEANLRNYIEAIQRDLDKALERAELYKMFGKEKIREIEKESNMQIELERQKNRTLSLKIAELRELSHGGQGRVKREETTHHHGDSLTEDKRG